MPEPDERAHLHAQLLALLVVEIGDAQDLDLVAVGHDREGVDDADGAGVAELDQLLGDAAFEAGGVGKPKAKIWMGPNGMTWPPQACVVSRSGATARRGFVAPMSVHGSW